MLIPDKGNQNWFKRLAAGSGRLSYVFRLLLTQLTQATSKTTGDDSKKQFTTVER